MNIPNIETSLEVSIEIVHAIPNHLLIRSSNVGTKLVRQSSIGPSIRVARNDVPYRLSFLLVSKEQFELVFIVSHVINVVVTVPVSSEPVLW